MKPDTFYRRLLGLLTLLLVITFPSLAADNSGNVVQWYIASFPPINITSGPNRGQGWGDRRLEAITRRLTGYQHEIVEASGIRMTEDMQRKPNICNTGLLKTPEREQYLIFSDPILWIIPNGAITTRVRYATLKPYLNDRGELKLAEYLQQANPRIGTHASRKYGKGIDATIQKYATANTLVAVPSGAYPAARLLKLANQDEYDIVLGYPAELRYLAREAALKESNFVFLSIVEEPGLIQTYVACSKSDLGQKVIAQVNKIIGHPQVQDELLVAYKHWLDDETAARYDRLRQQTLSNRRPGN